MMQIPQKYHLSKNLLISSVILLTFYLGGCATIYHETSLNADAAEVDSLAKDKAMNHFLSGSVHEEAGEMHAAAIEYQLSYLYDPTSSEIAMALAKVYLRLGHSEAAMKVLERYRGQFDDDPELLKMLARFYLRAGMKEEAVGCYANLTELRNLEMDEHIRYADLLAAIERTEEAIDQYLLYLERFGDDPQIYNKLGLLYLVTNNLPAADSTLQKVVKLDPNRHRVHFVLGGFAVNRAEWQDAERYFRDAIKGDSTQIRYWLELTFALNEQNRTLDAIEVIDDAMSLFPNVPQLYDMKGAAYEVLGDFDSAIEELHQSLLIDSLRVGPYITLGYIYHQMEDWDNSTQAYENGLEIEPENPVLLNNYAYMLSVQNFRLEDALIMVDQALELSPESASFQDTKGWILHQLGRHDEGLKYVLSALETETDNAELYEHLGYIHKALGNMKKSRESWQRALNLDPGNSKYRALLE